MLFGKILTFLHFLATLDFQAAPRQSGINFFDPKHLQGKVKIFRVGQRVDFSRYNDFRVGGGGVKRPPTQPFKG